MKEIILNGSEFIDIQTTHKILKKIFEFPDYYGENLDAFWDCIKEYSIYCSQNGIEKVIWEDFSVSQKNLGEEAEQLLQILEEANEKYGGFIIEIIP